MKFTATVLMVVALSGAQLLGQQKDSAHQLRQGNRKIAIGLALMGVGALVAPIATRRHGDQNGDAGGGPALKVSIGMIAVGSGIAWSGATQRRRALQPQTAVGIDVGREVSVRFYHRW